MLLLSEVQSTLSCKSASPVSKLSTKILSPETATAARRRGLSRPVVYPGVLAYVYPFELPGIYDENHSRESRRYLANDRRGIHLATVLDVVAIPATGNG